MSARAASPDEPLLAFVGACLARFGPGIRLRYQSDQGECVLAFPDKQPETNPPPQQAEGG